MPRYVRRGSRKRFRGPSTYDRVQDRKIRKLAKLWETKTHETTFTGSLANGTASLIGLNHGIAQGDDNASDRTGRMVENKILVLAYTCLRSRG